MQMTQILKDNIRRVSGEIAPDLDEDGDISEMTIEMLLDNDEVRSEIRALIDYYGWTAVREEADNYVVCY